MIFNEKNKRQKLLLESKQMRTFNGSESLKIMADMNRAVLRLCIDSIKMEKPKISEKELIRELKRIYSIGEEYERLR